VKRLIDEDHDANSTGALLASLVHASTQREPAPMDRQRVLRAVVAPSRAARFGTLSLGSAVAALSIVAVAAASVGGAVTVWKHRAAVASRVTSPGASDSAPPLDVPLPAVVPLPSPLAASASASSDVTAPPSRSTDAPSARLRAPSKAASLRDGEDPTPVLEAIRALRENGDPGRAGDLLSGYLRSHPRGVLVEDALALSIEAAVARHDGKGAADLGRRYLAQFPNGRYRAFAQRAGRN
jgi:hypothetical protein